MNRIKIGLILSIICLMITGCSNTSTQEKTERSFNEIDKTMKIGYKTIYEPTISDEKGQWIFTSEYEDSKSACFEVNFDSSGIYEIKFKSNIDAIYVYRNIDTDLKLDSKDKNVQLFYQYLDDKQLSFDEFTTWLTDYIQKHTIEKQKIVYTGKTHDEVLQILTNHGYSITLHDNRYTIQANDTDYYISGFSHYDQENYHIITAAIHMPIKDKPSLEILYREKEDSMSFYYSYFDCKWNTKTQANEEKTDSYCSKEAIKIVDEYELLYNSWLEELNLTREDIANFLHVHFKDLGKYSLEVNA